MEKISLISSTLNLIKLIPIIDRYGATSIRIIDEPTRQALSKEVRSLTYDPRPEYLASGVREQLSSCENLPESSLCRIFAKQMEGELNIVAERITPYPFSTPLKFTELSVQKYDTETVGITPHRDFIQSIDLICVLVIEGRGRFCICDDRQGRNPYEVDARAGNIILMRGPGFLGSDFRPMHFLDNIASTRYALGMRCVKTS